MSELYWPGMVYGSNDLIRHVRQVVIVPEQCELCWKHEAVYYDCSMWPATYVCCTCADWLLLERFTALGTVQLWSPRHPRGASIQELSPSGSVQGTTSLPVE